MLKNPPGAQPPMCDKVQPLGFLFWMFYGLILTCLFFPCLSGLWRACSLVICPTKTSEFPCPHLSGSHWVLPFSCCLPNLGKALNFSSKVWVWTSAKPKSFALQPTTCMLLGRSFAGTADLSKDTVNNTALWRSAGRCWRSNWKCQNVAGVGGQCC